MWSPGHRREVYGQNLRGLGQVRRLGLLWWVQPLGGGSAVSRLHADPGYSGLTQASQEDLRFARKRGQAVETRRRQKQSLQVLKPTSNYSPILCFFVFSLLSFMQCFLNLYKRLSHFNKSKQTQEKKLFPSFLTKLPSSWSSRAPRLFILQVDLDPNSGVFITMNPAGKGYGGRQKLPDNLKQLFRPVAMSRPDNELIAEVILYSEGFKNGEILGRKLVAIFNLARWEYNRKNRNASNFDHTFNLCLAYSPVHLALIKSDVLILCPGSCWPPSNTMTGAFELSRRCWRLVAASCSTRGEVKRRTRVRACSCF